MTMLQVYCECAQDIIYLQSVDVTKLTLGELRHEIAMLNNYDAGTAAAFFLKQNEAIFYDPALDKHLLRTILEPNTYVKLNIILNPPIHQNSLKALQDATNTRWPCCTLKDFFHNPTDNTNLRWVLKAVQRNGRALRFASRTFQANKEIVLNAVQQDGLAIQYASEHLKADKDIAWAALSQNLAAWEYIPRVLLADKDFEKILMKRDSEQKISTSQSSTSWSPMFEEMKKMPKKSRHKYPPQTRLTP